MDVQKYIKRLKFARADWSRNIGRFTNRDKAIEFLNNREFFFGDPIVVKYDDEYDGNKTKLMLAIGKSDNPTITAETTEVTGGIGPDAYELFDLRWLYDEVEKLWEALNEEISARTEGDEYLQEQIDELKEALDGIEDLIEELSGITESILEITGEGWTDSPDNVTLTDRIKRDEQLAGIVWGHNDGEPYDGHLDETTLPYASGESLAEMIETISNTLTKVLFEDDNKTKAIKFDYNSERNILYYTAGTETGEIKLSQAAIVDRAYYDAETEELVIEFILGEGEKQEVRIPVAGLITEWSVADTDTVHLNKERVEGSGPDILTAEVKVSDDADNMLVAKGDGLYVSNSGLTKVENDLGVIKEDLAVLEDGHFPADYFSGATINGSTNIQEALLKLDNKLAADEAKHDEDIADVREELSELSDRVESGFTAVNDAIEALDDKINSGFTKNKVEVELDGNAEHLTLESSFAQDGHIIYTLGETNIASKDELDQAMENVNGQIDSLNEGLGDEVAARESVKLVELPQNELDPDVRAAYVLDNNGNTGSTVIKVYKDSVIYKIYIGHVDDQITSPTDPTVIPGTGETAICFIYFDANGEYALSTNEFSVADELREAIENEASARTAADENLQNEIDSLAGVVQEEQDVVSIALNRLAEAVNASKTEVELERGVTHIHLEKRVGPDGQDIYVIGENNIASADEMIAGFDAVDTKCEELQDAIDEEASNRVLDMNSLSLEYDSDAQDLVLNWQASGEQRSTKVDVSDFVKDSFLEGVQVVLHDGVQCLEFSFRTYDGQPVPIYVPLTDLATIYTAGQGIDRQELEDNQIITVKIDEFARKNYLAKSDNGLLVTGVTEEIQEAVAAEAQARQDEDDRIWDALNREISARTAGDNEIREELYEFSASTNSKFDEYVRKDEVEDHLDSESTLPVQNKVITEELTDIREDISELIANALTGVTTDGSGDFVTGITRVGNEVVAGLGSLEIDDALSTASTNPVENKVITEALEDIYEEMSHYTKDGLTGVTMSGSGNLVTGISESANTVVAEMGNLIIDSALDSASTNPVENQAIAGALKDIQNEIDDILAGSIVGVEMVGEGNVITSITENERNMVEARRGTLPVDSTLDSASTNPVENKVIVEALEEVYDEMSQYTKDGLTGVTVSGSGNMVVSVEQNGADVEVTLGNLTIDSALDSASTNPVENRAIFAEMESLEDSIDSVANNLAENYYNKTEIDQMFDETISSVTENLNELWETLEETSVTLYNITTAETQAREEVDESLQEEIDAIEAGVGLDEDGNYIPKSGTTYLDDAETIEEEIDALDNGLAEEVSARTAADNEILESIREINDYMEDCLTGVTSGGTGNIVTAITKNGQDVVAELGVLEIDSELDSASTNPVENQAITKTILENELVTSAALNDLNRRKANVEDIPVALSELEGYDDMATKDDLKGFLPLSGGTMTGDISGETGVAVYMPGGFFQQSDERYKIFIGDVENALAKVSSIPTKYFYWLNMPDGPRQLGTSAQKVQEVFPEIVSGEDKLSVDYSKLSIVALAAIKELTEKVANLQKQIDELKK